MSAAETATLPRAIRTIGTRIAAIDSLAAKHPIEAAIALRDCARILEEGAARLGASRAGEAIDWVKDIVAAEFRMDRNLLSGRERWHPLALVRHAAIVLSLQLPGCTLKRVGVAFGRRSRGALLWATHAVRAAVETDAVFRARFERCSAALDRAERPKAPLIPVVPLVPPDRKRRRCSACKRMTDSWKMVGGIYLCSPPCGTESNCCGAPFSEPSDQGLGRCS